MGTTMNIIWPLACYLHDYRPADNISDYHQTMTCERVSLCTRSRHSPIWPLFTLVRAIGLFTNEAFSRDPSSMELYAQAFKKSE